jgi:hypothetical protein
LLALAECAQPDSPLRTAVIFTMSNETVLNVLRQICSAGLFEGCLAARGKWSHSHSGKEEEPFDKSSSVTQQEGELGFCFARVLHLKVMASKMQ